MYLLFKEISLLQGERVSFGNDRHDVHHLAEAPHELHVQGPQTGNRQRNEAKCHTIVQQGAAVLPGLLLGLCKLVVGLFQLLLTASLQRWTSSAMDFTPKPEEVGRRRRRRRR